MSATTKRSLSDFVLPFRDSETLGIILAHSPLYKSDWWQHTYYIFNIVLLTFVQVLILFSHVPFPLESGQRVKGQDSKEGINNFPNITQVLHLSCFHVLFCILDTLKKVFIYVSLLILNYSCRMCCILQSLSSQLFEILEIIVMQFMHVCTVQASGCIREASPAMLIPLCSIFVVSLPFRW